MFKYISEILGKFTQRQRVLALLIVLVSIVLITLGPSLIKDNDCKDVYEELNKQRSELLRLNSEIIGVQTECTNERLKREKEISDILNLIEDEMVRIERQSNQMVRESVRPILIDTTDSLNPQQSARPVRIVRPDFGKVMDNLHHLQEMVGEDGN